MNQQQIQVIYPSFNEQNTRAFLYPLLNFDKQLRAHGIQLSYANDTNTATQYPTVFITSSFYRNCWHEQNKVIDELLSLQQQGTKVYYFDLMASAGAPHYHALPHVHRYVKKQVYKNKQQYLEPHYGFRSFTDYFHKQHGVVDETDQQSECVLEPTHLDKIVLGYNSCFANYDFHGQYVDKIYQLSNFSKLLKASRLFRVPSANRANRVSCRISRKYSRNTIAYQRIKTHDVVQKFTATTPIKRWQYYRELANSFAVVSPFGFGEICYRDYESFIKGCLLIKPDMSHLETWPNLYQPNKTYLAYDWDCEQLESILQNVSARPADYLQICNNGQELYRQYVQSKEAGVLFGEQLLQVIQS